jgi:fibronectin-binding autotransporter adhesin
LSNSGSNSLILSGSNTYSGATTINSGTLQLGVANALSPATSITLANAASATLNLNDYNLTIVSLSGGGNNGGDVITGTSTGGTLTISGSTSTSYSGVISGSGGLILSNSGSNSLILAGSNTYSGSTQSMLEALFAEEFRTEAIMALFQYRVM